MQRVCLVTDLHLTPPQTAPMASHMQQLRAALAPCDLVVYLGDQVAMPCIP